MYATNVQARTVSNCCTRFVNYYDMYMYMYMYIGKSSKILPITFNCGKIFYIFKPVAPV